MKSDDRSRLIRRNILFSFLIKGWSGVIQLLLVPVTLFCLGNYENGIWMTISSILLWVDSLDIGIGNGLRNKLSEQIANNDYEKARESVSSAFFMLFHNDSLKHTRGILNVYCTGVLHVHLQVYWECVSRLTASCSKQCSGSWRTNPYAHWRIYT